MRVRIAALACLPILGLGIDSYDNFASVVVYPDEFLVRDREVVDEDGVVHTGDDVLSGEAWEQGPVLLAWSEIEQSGKGEGFNVVAHEMSHKLDMLNGEADGVPPLHAGMRLAEWTAAFDDAYDDLLDQLERDEEPWLDPYAAEDPAEFFAVCSEMFFDVPDVSRRSIPRCTRSSRRSTSRIRPAHLSRAHAATHARRRRESAPPLISRSIPRPPRRSAQRRRSRRTSAPTNARASSIRNPCAAAKYTTPKAAVTRNAAGSGCSAATRASHRSRRPRRRAPRRTFARAGRRLRRTGRARAKSLRRSSAHSSHAPSTAPSASPIGPSGSPATRASANTPAGIVSARTVTGSNCSISSAPAVAAVEHAQSRDARGRLRVAQREERGLVDARARRGEQPRAVDGEREPHERHVGRAELAGSIDARDEHVAEQHERDEARHTKNATRPSAADHALAQRVGRAAALARELGQLGGRDAHAEQADGQHVQRLRVAQPRDRADREQAREHEVDVRAHLHDAAAEDRGTRVAHALP